MQSGISITVAALGLIAIGISPLTDAANDGQAPWVGESFLGSPCRGSQAGNFGPYDYMLRGNMEVVSNAHFTPQVEQLVGGVNAAGPTSDLDYVLKVIPNHHRALNSAMIFHFRSQRDAYAQELRVGKTGYRLKSPIECYFQRAIHFRPNDSTARMLFASLLHKNNMLEASRTQYELALQQTPNEANLLYNYALLLIDVDEVTKAQAIADDLYADGFPLPGLKRRLSANVQ